MKRVLLLLICSWMVLGMSAQKWLPVNLVENKEEGKVNVFVEGK
jgi:hypothetical protein